MLCSCHAKASYASKSGAFQYHWQVSVKQVPRAHEFWVDRRTLRSSIGRTTGLVQELTAASFANNAKQHGHELRHGW